MIATVAALRALNDLIETGRMLEPVARRVDTAVANELSGSLDRLDAVRTRLVQDGPEYLDEAWAFVDGGRRVVAGYGIQLAEVVGRDRA